MKEVEGNPVRPARRIARALAATAVVAAALTWPASHASAAGGTYTVDTSADAVDDVPGDGLCATAAGECSLRAAVMEANTAPGTTTTIGFSSALTAVALTLSGGADGDGRDDVGDLDVAASVSITINGRRNPDNSVTTIKGDSLGDRHFEVAAGGRLDLVEVTLAGGHSAGDGGAVLTSGAVSVTNTPSATYAEPFMPLVGNQADGDGGAVAVRSGGSLVVKNSSTSTTGSRIDILGNHAQGSGGAFANAGYLEVVGSAPPMSPTHDVYVDSNSATLVGGGVANSGTFVLGCRGAVRSSTAPTGGDVHNAGQITMVGGEIDAGAATPGGSGGGGLYNDTTGQVAIKDSCGPTSVTRNWSSGDGGGIVNMGSIWVYDDATLSVRGGADSIDPARTTEAVDGGGIVQGAGTFLVDGRLEVDDVAVSGTGGGIRVTGGSLGTGPDGRVSIRSTTAANGGGLSVLAGTVDVALDAEANTALARGGHLAMTGGDVTLHGPSSLRTGLAATGGGIVVAGGQLHVENATLAHNKGTAADGAVRSSGGTTTLRHVTIADNSSGVTTLGSGTVTLQRSLLVRNGGQDCSGAPGTIVVGDFNVSDDGSCAPTGTDLSDPSRMPDAADRLDGDISVADPTSYALQPGNPAIDLVTDGGCGTPSTDQLGAARPVDGDGDGASACDAGAIEAGAVAVLRKVTGTVRWEPTAAPLAGGCVIGLPLDDDIDLTRGITAADGTYEMDAAQGVTYLVAFYVPLPVSGGHDHCDAEPDFDVAQPEWYRNQPVSFDIHGEVVFPDPSVVTLLDVDATDIAGVDACLGTDADAGADAPCPPVAAPSATGLPVAAPAAAGGGDDVASAGASSGSGASGGGSGPGASLALTGTEVHGLWLTGLLLVVCGAMVTATSRRELRFGRR
ncbi:choice-of-anchor Q domain-containing protein [Dermatobacter hominis]|uniref:choice-of-anchor Q domain-containing protein n=1 Tax=Dermatobacter hominis TaxID=2884263 RepID=UPI001D122B5E|nr:choice-of-anchor Q domain-containing protein [Dermatobacter hominis]UDY37929.1 hypothetical protein LH044_10380 [Dermatobacter hominis]